MDNSVNVTWNSRAAGIMSIIMGSLAFLAVCIFGLFLWAMSDGLSMALGAGTTPGYIFFMVTLLFAVPSIFAITGGILAFKRRKWGWLLAGVICSMLYFNILGIPALILTIKGKSEFR